MDEADSPDHVMISTCWSDQPDHICEIRGREGEKRAREQK